MVVVWKPTDRVCAHRSRSAAGVQDLSTPQKGEDWRAAVAALGPSRRAQRSNVDGAPAFPFRTPWLVSAAKRITD